MKKNESIADDAGNSIQRQPGGKGKFQEKQGNYSPSVSYNYNPGKSYNKPGGHQSIRRRNEHQKRDNGNSQTDRLIKQNDIIIRLLKEIKERLPEQNVTKVNPSEQKKVRENSPERKETKDIIPEQKVSDAANDLKK